MYPVRLRFELLIVPPHIALSGSTCGTCFVYVVPLAFMLHGTVVLVAVEQQAVEVAVKVQVELKVGEIVVVVLVVTKQPTCCCRITLRQREI